MDNESIQRKAVLKEAQSAMGFTFNKIEYLDRALTHSSYRNRPDYVASYRNINECLEFLGDAVLDFVIGEHLFHLYPDWNEGRLSKVRAKIVCEQSLSMVAKKLELWKYILVGKGENNGENMNVSIMADAVEAIIAAIYLDSGLEETRKCVMRLFADNIEQILTNKILRDSKTDLQELLQQLRRSTPTYVVQSKVGPQHDATFTINAVLDGKVIGTGTGKSKKEAEQEAAAKAIIKINQEMMKRGRI